MIGERPICLRCDYDLTGLSEGHCCHECGFDLVPDMVAVPLGARGRAFWWVLTFGAIGVLALWRLRAGRGFHHKDWWLVYMATVGLLPILRGYFTRNVHPRRMYLTRDGVFIDQRTPKRMRWEEIGEISQSWVTGALVIRTPARRTLARLSCGDFKSMRELRGYVAQMQRLKENGSAPESRPVGDIAS